MGGIRTALNFPSQAGQAIDAKHKIETAKQNAQLADLAAKDALNRGTVTAGKAQLQGAELQGKQEAAYGASGVTVAGSPSDVMRDTSYFTNLNVQTAMNNAAREAWGYKVRANQFRDEATATQEEAELKLGGEAITGELGAGLLGGGGGG